MRRKLFLAGRSARRSRSPLLAFLGGLRIQPGKLMFLIRFVFILKLSFHQRTTNSLIMYVKEFFLLSYVVVLLQ